MDLGAKHGAMDLGAKHPVKAYSSSSLPFSLFLSLSSPLPARPSA
jgi:hypothetical protein